MLKLYQYEISPFCDKIRRVLHVKKQPYEVREILPSESLYRLKKINPIGKVPCLEHDDRFVADSTDIAHYLEQTFPDPPLIPTDPAEGALCHILEDWADESLYFYEMRLRFTFPHNAKHWNAVVTKGENAVLRAMGPFLVRRHTRAIVDAQGVGRKPPEMVLADVERHLDAVAGYLGKKDWLVGERLTLADISVFAQLFCIRGAQEGATLIAARPVVAAWMGRVEEATAKPPA